MKNIILIVSLLLMGVSSRADILNSSDNKNVADKFDPMLKAALFQMKIIADTSSILLSDIDYVEDLELKTSLWINNDVNRAKTTRHEITSLKGLEYFSSLRRLKLVGNRTDTLECIPDFSRFKELRELEIIQIYLPKLDISGCKNLTNLSCRSCDLNTIDLKKNIQLRTLDCTYNRLIELDLSHNKQLRTVIVKSQRNKGLLSEGGRAGILSKLILPDTEKSITDQFYSVYMAQSNLEISREELVNAQQSYDIIKNKVEADLAAKDELFQAELNLATARSSVDESQVNLENAKDKLKQTLGMRLDEDILVFAEVEIKPIQVNLDQAISHGLGSRLELRQREIESKELEFDMIKTKALNEFKGDVSISFGLIGDNSHLNKVYNNPTQNPRVSISFAVPIFDWGEKKARIKAQKMAQRINELEFQEDKVDIELNIRQVWRNLENLRTQIKIAEQNVQNAQLTYDLNQTRYREGDITGMEMSQFQTQLSNKKITYTQALINYRIELLNLKILSLYDFDKNIPLVPMKDIIDKK